jgi:hypothetical protein
MRKPLTRQDDVMNEKIGYDNTRWDERGAMAAERREGATLGAAKMAA